MLTRQIEKRVKNIPLKAWTSVSKLKSFTKQTFPKIICRSASTLGSRSFVAKKLVFWSNLIRSNPQSKSATWWSIYVSRVNQIWSQVNFLLQFVMPQPHTECHWRPHILGETCACCSVLYWNTIKSDISSGVQGESRTPPNLPKTFWNRQVKDYCLFPQTKTLARLPHPNVAESIAEQSKDQIPSLNHDLFYQAIVSGFQQ